MTTEHPPSVCPSWCVRDQREDGPMFALDPITWHYAAPLVVHTSRGNGTISRAGVHDAADVDVAAALTWAAGVAGPIAAATELTGGMTSTMLRLQSVSGPDVVLRLMTREPWRSHGEGLATRESPVQQMLADTLLPVPRSLALDAGGQSCAYPAHLMSLLPGHTDPDRADPAALGQMADLLAAVHHVEPTIEVRPYQSWAWEAKYVPPQWAKDASVWEDAFAVLRSDPPEHDQCFIHRDFGPHNVLWSDGQVSGVVDWVETSLGPAWLDVAHCCTNIALVRGNQPADIFADAYTQRTGRAAQPYFDVMDIVVSCHHRAEKASSLPRPSCGTSRTAYMPCYRGAA